MDESKMTLSQVPQRDSAPDTKTNGKLDGLPIATDDTYSVHIDASGTVAPGAWSSDYASSPTPG